MTSNAMRMSTFADHRRSASRCSLFALLAVSLVGTSACDKKKKTPAPQQSEKAAKVEPSAKPAPKQDPAPKPADLKAPAKVLPLAAHEAKFATTLFGHSAKEVKNSDNFVMSPMSVYVALGMTRLGAKAATADALNQTLALPKDTQALSIASSMGQAQRVWTQSRPGSQLAIANRLFADETFKIQPSFVEMTKTHLDAGIQNLAFARQTDAARKTINDWVAKQTKDRIKDLLSPGDVSPKTRLVLVNAIWFKGEWAHPFDKKKTKKRPFKLASKKTVKVPTMHMTHDFPLLDVKSQGYTALDLPYADGRLAMSIILPKNPQDLPELESSLDLHAVSKALDKAMPYKVEVSLPKFTIDPERSISLRAPLSKMGAATIFGNPPPDFSAMTQGTDKLAIQDVVHKAMIIVDEKGAEAAAATAVTVYRTAAVLTPKKFNASHPFLFMIRDKKDGSILFAGRVANPSS